MAQDLYNLLGIPSSASAAEIKKAYRRLAKKHHPDANRGSPGSSERFKAINHAYQILRNPETRSQYDLSRVEGGNVSGGHHRQDRSATGRGTRRPDSKSPKETTTQSRPAERWTPPPYDFSWLWRPGAILFLVLLAPLVKFGMRSRLHGHGAVEHSAETDKQGTETRDRALLADIAGSGPGGTGRDALPVRTRMNPGAENDGVTGAHESGRSAAGTEAVATEADRAGLTAEDLTLFKEFEQCTMAGLWARCLGLADQVIASIEEPERLGAAYLARFMGHLRLRHADEVFQNLDQINELRGQGRIHLEPEQVATIHLIALQTAVAVQDRERFASLREPALQLAEPYSEITTSVHKAIDRAEKAGLAVQD